MVTLPGLKELRARKQALILESDLNRQVLRLEVEQIRLRGQRLKRSYGWLNLAWKWTLPLAQLWARRKSNDQRGTSRGAKAFWLLARAWETWQTLRPKDRGPGGGASV